MIGAKTPRKNVPDTEFGPRNRLGLVYQKFPFEIKGKLIQNDKKAVFEGKFPAKVVLGVPPSVHIAL